MERTYKYRLYPTKEQALQIQNNFDCTRFVYNYYLGMRKLLYEEFGLSRGYYDCCANLTLLKKERTWLRDADAQSLQNALKDLDRAYQNFFRGLKTGENVGFPKFKSKKDNHKSYRSQNIPSKRGTGSIEVFSNSIKLPKLANVKCRVSKQIHGRILSATVSQVPSGKYFVSVCCTDEVVEPLEKTGEAVGIDLGIKDFAILSNGTDFENPKCFSKSQKKLARLQRELSRKSSGSANYEKARIKVARQYEKVANQRKDFQHKLSTKLVKEYDTICVETLRPANLVKNHHLAKSISDASFGEFVEKLTYKCDWYGKNLVKIDTFFPSSQLCSNCGFKNAGTKDLRVRKWTCSECGAEHDRDINAAKNILKEGLSLE